MATVLTAWLSCLLHQQVLPEMAGVALSASRVTCQGDDFAYIQTLVRPENSNHGFAGGPAIHPVPEATKLEAYFSISATNGDYKLDTPVEIARLDGKPVMLVVGKPTK
jgi:hypothetical protein